MFSLDEVDHRVLAGSSAQVEKEALVFGISIGCAMNPD
jgi:hypothetical protein